MSWPFTPPETIDDLLDKSDVMDLAAAIARGDCAAAAECLDHMARSDATLREWVARGRASNMARTRAATPETTNV